MIMHTVQHSSAAEGAEISAPDAVLTVRIDALHTDDQYEVFEVDAPRGPATPLHRTGWAKTYYVLAGRMVLQVDDEAFDIGPGSAVAIPPHALHTFTVVGSSVRFLCLAMSGAMGRFQRDLAAAVDPALPLEQSMPQIAVVLSRHDVSVAGLETVS